VDTQDEYEFFTQATERPGLTYCCGPLTPLGFVDPARSQFFTILAHLKVPANYLDNFDTQVLDSGVLIITMCAKHWINHSQAITKVALSESVAEWHELAYTVYRQVCTLHNWDFKEISNYFSTIEILNQKE
jgi:hypothetical protein